jgi:protein phosphatase
MGTTCTTLLVRDGQATVGHVGDSRAYLIRDGRIRMLTRDHSLVAQLIEQGQLTREEARTDPRRNVVTRSVGVQPTVDVDIVSLGEEVRPGDTFLLCSDGLHGQVTDLEIARAVEQESLDRACRDLVALANQRGGPDNITVLLARIENVDAAGPARRASPRPRRAEAPDPTSRRRLMSLLLAALVALMIALGGLAWVVWGMLRSTPRAEAASATAGDTNRWR